MAEDAKYVESKEGQRREHRNKVNLAWVGVLVAVVGAVSTGVAAHIGAEAPHPPDQKPNIVNDIKIGFQVMTNSVSEAKTTAAEKAAPAPAPVSVQPTPQKTEQPVTAATNPLPESQPAESSASAPCLGLDPNKLKVGQYCITLWRRCW